METYWAEGTQTIWRDRCRQRDGVLTYLTVAYWWMIHRVSERGSV